MNTRAIRDLLAVLNETLPQFVSTRDQFRRQFAAAGLGLSSALLEGICLLVEHGRDDLVGLLARFNFEVWVVSLYLLLQGKDAEDDTVLVELGAAHFKAVRTINQQLQLGPRAQEQVQEWEDVIAARQGKEDGNAEAKPLNYEALARALTPLLKTVDPGWTTEVIEIYDRVYRGESTYSAHAGVGTLNRYYKPDPRGQRDSIVANPGAPFPRAPIFSAELTVILLERLRHAFGMAPDVRLRELFQRLSQEDLEA
jgi:hypothetical protein